MENYLFLGGDKRIIYAAELISQTNGVSAAGLGGDFPQPSGKYARIVLPLPFSRDGININAPLSEEAIPLDSIPEYAQAGGLVLAGGSSERLEKLCADNGLRLVNYFAGEELTLKNALLTAEGAVSLLISESDGSLFNSSVVITGYGRIAYYLAGLLRGFRCRVTITARSSVQRERAILDGFCALPASLAGLAAESADLIINTAPAELFSKDDFARMRKTALYMELASKPAQPEKGYAEAAGIKHIMAAGLPGKFSPRTAGEAIAQAITAAADRS